MLKSNIAWQRTPYQLAQDEHIPPPPVVKPPVIEPVPPALASTTAGPLPAFVLELQEQNAAARLQNSLLERRLAEAAETAKQATTAVETAKAEATRLVAEATTAAEQKFAKATLVSKVKAEAEKEMLDPTELDAFDLAAKIKLDDTGALVGAKEFLADLKAKRPYLFKDFYELPTNTAVGHRRPTPKPGDPPVFNAMTAKPEDADRAIKEYLASVKGR